MAKKTVIVYKPMSFDEILEACRRALRSYPEGSSQIEKIQTQIKELEACSSSK